MPSSPLEVPPAVRPSTHDGFIDAPLAARVTWFSWATAVFEIIANIVIGLVGNAVLKSRARARAAIAVAGGSR